MASMSSGSLVILRSSPVHCQLSAVDLDSVAFGVVEVKGLAHRVVGCACQRHLVACHMMKPPREIGACRHEEGGVIEPRLARIIGFGVGLVLQANERHAAGAEGGPIFTRPDD